MRSRGALERRLAVLEGFTEPRAPLEQYPTPPDIAAHVIHLAALNGDIADRTVVDLGTGTGILALGAALCEPPAAMVLGLDRDPEAITTARANERRVAAELDAPVSWLLGDASRVPLCTTDATIVMNPPFGAHASNVHADRAFLETAARIGAVSYSIHNAGSREFLESFVTDVGGDVTHAFRAELSIDRQFDFHTHDRADLDAEVVRIVWPRC